MYMCVCVHACVRACVRACVCACSCAPVTADTYVAFPLCNQEKEDLESLLHESQEHLDDSRSSLSHLRRQQQEEKMYRAK